MKPYKPVFVALLISATSIGVYEICDHTEHIHRLKQTQSLESAQQVAGDSSASPESRGEPSHVKSGVKSGVDSQASVTAQNSSSLADEPASGRPVADSNESGKADETLSMVPGAIPGMMPMQVISPAIIKSVKNFNNEDAVRQQTQLKKIHSETETADSSTESEHTNKPSENEKSDEQMPARKPLKWRHHYYESHRLAHLKHTKNEKWRVAKSARTADDFSL
jgi:hypothetical protein